MKALDAGGIALERLGYLDRQLTGGSEHHDLYLVLLEIETGQQRQGKSCSFSGTGWRMAQQIQALEQVRDGLRLDRGRCFITHLIQCGQQGGRQVQVAKSGIGKVCIGHRNFLVRGGVESPAPAAQYNACPT